MQSCALGSAICARIASHAADAPHRVAVVDERERIDYARLDARANALAALLQEAGAEPERCIGIMLDRSVQFVVAALAVLKSGAAYVPLDPATPPDRAKFILSDAAAIAVVTDARRYRELHSVCCRAIDVDAIAASHDVYAGECETDPQSLAYVVYTSGSTGEPKGVEITHANLRNLVEWHQSAFAVDRADRASQVAGLGFDAAVWEIWPYLTAGASLHIAGDETRRSAHALRDWIVAQKITIGFVPTILAEQLIRTDWPSGTALRILLTGGDALHHRPVAGLPFAVVNNYGPTECTVVATSARVLPYGESDVPSIGRPIDNASALILDESLRPVENGDAGELCIAGALVGRGYRNRPGLTAQQFVTYTQPGGGSQRIYRTGDRARLLRSGEIAFLGRTDDQVKVRGYRIELGDVTASLSRCPGVQSAAVTVGTAAGEEAYLIGYVVPATGAQLTDSSVRAFLGSQLPEYMIPPMFVALATLPLTTSGKIDKAALPEPAVDNLLSAHLKSAPVPAAPDGVQRQVAELVCELLERPSIAIDENFFMAGGHSMLGVQLVARIRDVFGVKLPLRQLFMAPTIRALSAEVMRLSEAA